MSTQTVYDALKQAIAIHGLPYNGFNDNQYTILFESLNQFRPFDCYLGGIDTITGIKLCIYSGFVAGNHDGVAVTVADEGRQFNYWDSRTFVNADLDFPLFTD